MSRADHDPSATAPLASDRVDAVTAHGTTDVRAAVVSLSARSPDGEDAAYLEWHGLDHLPEQHRIAGMRNGARWVSTPECRAARAAASPRYDEVDHVVCYLFAEPLAPALDTFFALGADLRGAGRMPRRLPSVELAGWERRGGRASPAALVGVDVLPWRPTRGAYLLIEAGPAADPDDLVDVPGVAGAWTFDGSGTLHDRLASTDGLHLTIAYLEHTPSEVALRLAEVLRDRWAPGVIQPLLAAPFVTVVPWAWDAAVPSP